MGKEGARGSRETVAKEDRASRFPLSQVPDISTLFQTMKSSVETPKTRLHTSLLTIRKTKPDKTKQSVLEPGSIPTKGQRLVPNLAISTKHGRREA